MGIQGSIAAHKGEILRIAGEHGARRLRVFGSVARREADEESDLDLLVEMEPGRSLFDMGALLIELEELLGCSVDVVTEAGMHDAMRERVLREAVALEDVA